MQSSDRISLNALRVFLQVARRLSIKQTAEAMALSSGAVSHQVRQLEETLGQQLFQRGNNSLVLTDAGQQLADQARPGIQIATNALQAVQRDAEALTVNVSATFAMRWLVPRLEQFQSRNPASVIRLETHAGTGMPGQCDADLIIGYHVGDTPPDQKGEVLISDMCRPVLAPDLLTRMEESEQVGDYPALQCAPGNRDWQLWLDRTGQRDVPLRYAAAFDLDETAIRAAIAGMGMLLSPDFVIADDLAAHRLVALPDAPKVMLGCYMLSFGRRQTALSRRFATWLKEMCRNEA